MYKLMLTLAERRAIDFVGARYGHGYDLWELLWLQSEAHDDTIAWEDDDDIVFDIPENVAWQIKDIAEECDYNWDLFAPELAEKLTLFCDEVV